MENINSRIGVALAACGVALLLGAPARAADASPWVEDSYSAIRLIAGANKNGADSLRAGIEIKMQPGWHTYWRYPGDSGVPPRFSFSGSDNLATVKVLYPAPHAFTDEAGTTIGYKGSVILPLQVFPRQKDKPVTLRAKIDYAVCEKLCVPVEANVELTLRRGRSGQCRACRGRSARAATGCRRRGRIDRAPRQRRQAQAAGIRRSRRAHRPAGRTVRRGTDGGMGLAHPQAGARRAARPRAFRFRARWAAARRRSQGPVRTHFHDCDRATAPPRSRLISTNPPAALFCIS